MKNWPTPKTVQELRSFLGLVSYYRRFISNCSRIARPLHKLVEKDVEFNFDQDCEEAFSLLKNKLITSPILVYPSRNEKFVLDTDASDFAIGAVLSQVQDGVERVIGYASRTLGKHERKYCVTRKELLAVVHFVKYYKHYLTGRPFLLRTDHGALQWLRNFKDADGQMARWISVLDTFDMTIQHRPGKSHGNADALSRMPPLPVKLKDILEEEESENTAEKYGRENVDALPETPQSTIKLTNELNNQETSEPTENQIRVLNISEGQTEQMTGGSKETVL